ncbi:MAG: hypothetical protein ACYSU0_11740 [Planctomycetota bacterium]
MIVVADASRAGYADTLSSLLKKQKAEGTPVTRVLVYVGPDIPLPVLRSLHGVFIKNDIQDIQSRRELPERFRGPRYDDKTKIMAVFRALAVVKQLGGAASPADYQRVVSRKFHKAIEEKAVAYEQAHASVLGSDTGSMLTTLLGDPDALISTSISFPGNGGAVLTVTYRGPTSATALELPLVRQGPEWRFSGEEVRRQVTTQGDTSQSRQRSSAQIARLARQCMLECEGADARPAGWIGRGR